MTDRSAPLVPPAVAAAPSGEGPGRDEVARALEALRAVLGTSAELVKAGRMVDLVGLDREVQQTLEAVTTLPAADARALLPALDALLAVLDTIALDLQQMHGAALPDQDTQLARQRAAAAYRRTEEES